MTDTILIAASGTGGHLMPAILIANELKSYDVQFIGAGRPLEEKMVDSRGFVRHVVPVVGVQNRGIKGIFEFAIGIPINIYRIWKLYSKLRPKLVIGVGGYVSVLPVIFAWLKGIPTIIHECETKPGLANSALEFFATRITSAFPNVPFKYFEKVTVTGQPIKPEVVAASQKVSIPERPTRLLVMGGSQGARSLDEACQELASFFAEHSIEVWHQTRPGSEKEVEQAYKGARVKARVETFIQAMEEAYVWAHVILSRSGAGSVSEIAAVNLPAIFVPFPSAQGNHQVHNAEMLVSREKAFLCEEGEGFVDRLKEQLIQILKPDFYKEMRDREGLKRGVNAAKEIAKIADSLIAQQKLD